MKWKIVNSILYVIINDMPISYRRPKRFQQGGVDAENDKMWQQIIKKTNDKLQGEWGTMTNSTLSTLSTLSNGTSTISLEDLKDKLKSNPLSVDDIESLKSRLTTSESSLDEEALKSAVSDLLTTKVDATDEEVGVINELVGELNFGNWTNNINTSDSDIAGYSGVLSTQPSFNGSVNSTNSSLNGKITWPSLNGTINPAFGRFTTEESANTSKAPSRRTTSSVSNTNGNATWTPPAFGSFPPGAPLSQLATNTSKAPSSRTTSSSVSNTNPKWSSFNGTFEPAFGSFLPGARLSQLITGTSSKASSNPTSRRTSSYSLPNASNANSNASSTLLDYLLDENMIKESFDNINIYKLSEDLTVGDFYDPNAANDFPYKILNDTREYGEAKEYIKSLLHDISSEHEGVIDSILESDNPSMDKTLIFQRYVTYVSRLTILLSRVYVCVLVSEINSTSPLTSSASTMSELTERVDTLKKVLSDIVPFLLQLEGERN